MYLSNSAASAYARVGMETGVSAADPHKLILMLYEGAILAVLNAISHLDRGDTAQKGASISHAISIIDSGLKASLDLNTGGEIASNLATLYEYMSNRLLLSNLKNEKEGMEEVKTLLIELKGAWEEIGKKQVAQNVGKDADTHRKASLSYGQI